MEDGLAGAVGAEVAWDTILGSTRALIRDMEDMAVAMVATSEVVGVALAMEVAVVTMAAMATGATMTLAMGSRLLAVDVAPTEEDTPTVVVVGVLAGSISMVGHHAAPAMGPASQPP
jgi:hypothetical protein